MKVVLDTDVVVAAIRSPKGASAEIVRRAAMQQLRLAVSTALMIEYEAVCLRPEHVQAAGITVEAMHHYLNGLAALALPIRNHFRWRPLLRDAADEMVLETAINARADALVTFNRKHFRQEQFALEVLLPGELLQRLSL